MHLEGYGCAGASATAYGLTCLELEAGDSGLRSFCSVQGSLAMFAIHRWGSEEQKEHWLPGMAAGDDDRLLRPDRARRRLQPGGDAHAREEGRRRLGPQRLEDVDHQRLARRRRGRLGAHRGRRGQRLPGREGHARASARRSCTASSRCARRSPASWCSTACACPRTQPPARGRRRCARRCRCLNEARFGIVWGAAGAARACYEAALDYAKSRVQFGKPIAGFQLTQAKLVEMAVKVGQCDAARAAPRAPEGRRARCAPSRSPSASTTT